MEDADAFNNITHKIVVNLNYLERAKIKERKEKKWPKKWVARKKGWGVSCNGKENKFALWLSVVRWWEWYGGVGKHCVCKNSRKNQIKGDALFFFFFPKEKIWDVRTSGYKVGINKWQKHMPYAHALHVKYTHILLYL